MLQARNGPSLHMQTAALIDAGLERGNELDGHIAVERQLARSVHVAHAPRADAAQDLEAVELPRFGQIIARFLEHSLLFRLFWAAFEAVLLHRAVHRKAI